MALTLEGELTIEGPKGAKAVFSGEGETAVLSFKDLKSAQALLSSKVLRQQIKKFGIHSKSLDTAGLTLEIKVARRTVLKSGLHEDLTGSLMSWLSHFAL